MIQRLAIDLNDGELSALEQQARDNGRKPDPIEEIHRLLIELRQRQERKA